MKGRIPIILLLLMTPLVAAWNTTIEIPERHYYVIDDLTINVTSPCPQWVFLTLYGPEESRTASFFADDTKVLHLYNLSPEIFSLLWKNVTVFVRSQCPLNISITPEYYPDICGKEYYVSSWRYRIVKMPLQRTGERSYKLNSPLRIEAIYFLTKRSYVNGTSVTALPLEVEIALNNKSLRITPAPIGNSYWWYRLKSPESGHLNVTLSGVAAEYIGSVYVLALLPQEDKIRWIPSYTKGYHPPHCGPVSYMKMSGEALWEGENFTLLKYMTENGEEKEVYVKNLFICAKIERGVKVCSGPLLPGPSRFEIVFSSGVLEINQWDRTVLTLELENKGISPILFLGLPNRKLYGMEIYARNPVPWEEKRRNWVLIAGLVLIATGSIAAIWRWRH